MPPTILITRPAPAAAQFAARLTEVFGENIRTVLSPLMQVAFCGVLPDLATIKTLIFTSQNGVAAFLEASARRDIPCYCVGDATAAKARTAGLSAISCQGAAADLVSRMIAEGAAGPCLHIRGEHGVGEVAQNLSDAGIPTSEVVLYRQDALPLTPEAQALLQGDSLVLVPLFSPRSAHLLFETVEIKAPIGVAAISPNVADAVPKRHRDRMVVAGNPDAEEMIVALGKLLDQREGA